MKALSIEQQLLEGEHDVKQLFAFVQDQAATATAYEMEQAVFTRVMQIGLTAMGAYFAQKGTGDVGEAVCLSDGQQVPREAGLHGRIYHSVFGKLTVPRTYYHEPGQPGVFPLDAQADLPEQQYSYLLQEWMDFFSLREPFQEAERSLATLLGCEVKASRFKVVSRESSASYETFYAAKAPPAPETEGAFQVIGGDGKGVPVIKAEAVRLQARLKPGEKRQKKKEAMVGVSYTIDPHVRTADEVAENLIYPEQARAKREAAQQAQNAPPPPPTAQHIRRCASLERSREEVLQAMVADGQQRQSTPVRPWIVVMDGALALWTVIASVFGDIPYVGILDIIHVTEYLWEAGIALFGGTTPETHTWVYNHLVAILRGEVGYVIGGLRQTLTKRALTGHRKTAFTTAIRYFSNHRQWMRYDEYLAAGYPIGSGVVESTCGHTVKDRMEGAGRRWSIKGAEATLLLRSVYTSGDWDAYWEAHMVREHDRLYGRLAHQYHDTDAPSLAVGM